LLIVESPTLDHNEVRVTVRTDERTSEITWSLPGPADGSATDAATAATLLSAMARREPLSITEPTSERLLAAIPAIQDIFVTWSRQAELRKGVPPIYRHVDVTATPRRPPLAPLSNEVAAFFSGGVDSFYTVWKHREELTALVFVHGFDIPLENIAQRELVADAARQAADALGLRLLEVTTDVRNFCDEDVKWLDSHGAVLASVALLLGPWCRRIYLPATQTYGTLLPLGSHPLVDPLWSTERVEIVHDGCEADRVDKLRSLANVPAAHKWLRVCLKNTGYNCGRCEKCLRTMTAITALGLQDRFESFPMTSERRLCLSVARANLPANRSTWDACAAEAKANGHRGLGRAIGAAYGLRKIRVPLWYALQPIRGRWRARRVRTSASRPRTP
jgi:7-cyano-7-deazaguanine synthase in queuosine biosynthesis